MLTGVDWLSADTSVDLITSLCEGFSYHRLSSDMEEPDVRQQKLDNQVKTLILCSKFKYQSDETFRIFVNDLAFSCCVSL